MKLKENFVLRQVADIWVVLPLGSNTLDFSGMLKLNDSGALLWKVLENKGGRAAMIAALTSEYEVSEDRAAADVDAFLNKLMQAGCVEQE